MAAVSSVRAGIATNLATISGLHVSSTVPQTIRPPMAVVMFNGFPEPRSTMAKGVTEMEFEVVVFVGNASSNDSGEDAMDAYVATTGASSVWVALESDRTLSGTALESIVTDMSGYEWVAVSSNQLAISCTWTVRVWANGAA